MDSWAIAALARQNSAKLQGCSRLTWMDAGLQGHEWSAQNETTAPASRRSSPRGSVVNLDSTRRGSGEESSVLRRGNGGSSGRSVAGQRRDATLLDLQPVLDRGGIPCGDVLGDGLRRGENFTDWCERTGRPLLGVQNRKPRHRLSRLRWSILELWVVGGCAFVLLTRWVLLLMGWY